MESCEWDISAADQCPWSVAYLDATKCFDSFRHDDVARVALALGFPMSVMRCLRSFYSLHSRHFLVKGWLTLGFSPVRGIPQGCPLSPLIACIWASTWIATSNALKQSASWSAHVLQSVYLDDMCVGANDCHALQQLIAVSVIHFQKWGISLNLAKSGLCINAAAKTQDPDQGQLATLQNVQSQILLGADTGWMPLDCALQSRLDASSQMIDRVRLLPVPRWSMVMIVSKWIAPQWYGIEFTPLLPLRTKLSRKLFALQWGTSRVATNWQSALALCIPSHRSHPLGFQVMSCWRAIHRMAHRAAYRPLVLRLWSLTSVPRCFGLWHCFIQSLRFLGGRLLDNGLCTLDHLGITLSVDSSKRRWMHMARHIWRCKLMQLAAGCQRDFFPSDVRCLDWPTVRDCLSCFPQLSTVVTRSVNSKDRAFRHFHVGHDGLCEHDCGCPDSMAHRALECVATEPLRDNARALVQGLPDLQTHPLCTRECFLWLLPLDCCDFFLRANGDGLWMNSDLVGNLMSRCKSLANCLPETFHLSCYYAKVRLGNHPWLKCHSMSVACPELSNFFQQVWAPR